ncbi:cellulase family glycosylhydrolase [Actinomycetes bacterium M1A6_2h]
MERRYFPPNDCFARSLKCCTKTMAYGLFGSRSRSMVETTSQEFRMRAYSRREILIRGAATGVVAVGALALGRESAVRVPVAPASRTTFPIGYSAGSAILYMNDADQNQTLDCIVATGGTQVRFDIPWFFVQPTATAFNWGFVDVVVDKARARNLSILGVITGSPPWAAVNQSGLATTRPASAATYAQFCRATAQRYLGKIAAYEIWNEPNGSMFFSPSPNPAFYASMVKAAYPAIKAVSSSITVVAGALGPTVNANGRIHAVDFTTAMYNAGIAGNLDGLSFHPYENDATFAQACLYDNSPARQMIAMHSIMKARGDGAKKIWLTEYGASTADITADQQANLVVGSLMQWQEVSFAGPVYVYTIRDADSSVDESESQFGAFTSTYQPKSLAYGIQNLTVGGNPERYENQVMTANGDSALGGTVTPVFRISYGFGQECENGTRFLSNAGFLSSPPAVATVARYNQLLPITPFANDMQDFDKQGGYRVYSRPATTGTHVLMGSFITAWTAALGFPKTDIYSVPGTQNLAVDCEKGRITYSPTAGTTVTMA